MFTILQQHVGTKLLTTDFELVVDVSQHPAGPFELQQEGKDLVVLGQAGIRDHHVVWPLNLSGTWRGEDYMIYSQVMQYQIHTKLTETAHTDCEEAGD